MAPQEVAAALFDETKALALGYGNIDTPYSEPTVHKDGESYIATRADAAVEHWLFVSGSVAQRLPSMGDYQLRLADCLYADYSPSRLIEARILDTNMVQQAVIPAQCSWLLRTQRSGGYGVFISENGGASLRLWDKTSKNYGPILIDSDIHGHEPLLPELLKLHTAAQELAHLCGMYALRGIISIMPTRRQKFLDRLAGLTHWTDQIGRDIVNRNSEIIG